VVFHRIHTRITDSVNTAKVSANISDGKSLHFFPAFQTSNIAKYQMSNIKRQTFETYLHGNL
jgi:hypothetical protein